MKKILLCMSLILLFDLSFADIKFLPDYPFKIGEKLKLTVSILGVYIGDQEVSIDGSTNYNGYNVYIGSEHLFTTPFISSLYKVDDSAISYIVPENYIPIYYERWINEGSWHDNIKFNFSLDGHKVEFAQKMYNYEKKTAEYEGILRNYFTLIFCMRGIDYNYHIKNKVNIDIAYLFGTNIKKASFKASYQKINFKGKDTDSIYLEEIGGVGINFYILNDENRTPIRLIIPAFEVIGFKTISVYAELKEFIKGTIDIPTNQ